MRSDVLMIDYTRLAMLLGGKLSVSGIELSLSIRDFNAYPFIVISSSFSLL